MFYNRYCAMKSATDDGQQNLESSCIDITLLGDDRSEGKFYFSHSYHLHVLLALLFLSRILWLALQ